MEEKIKEGRKTKNKEVKKGHRSLKREENKNFSTYVIKTTLNSAFNKKLTENEQKLIKNNLTLRSIEMSKGLNRLSLAVNILLFDCLEKKKEIPTFLSKNNDNKNEEEHIECENEEEHIESDNENEEEPIKKKNKKNTGTTFLKQILDPKGTKKTDPRVIDFLDMYGKNLPNSQTRFKGDRNTIVNAVNMYITNFKTYLETTFEKNQKYYIKIWTEKNNLESYKSVIFSLINYNSCSYFKNYEPNEKVSEFVNYNRNLLGFKENETLGNTKIFVSKNYENIIKYNYEISKFLISNGYSGLLIAPICNIQRSYVHIDRDVFYYILKEMNLLSMKNDKSINKDEFIENSEDYFKIFNTDKFLTMKQRNTCKFTYTIKTDGHCICILYMRPKLNLSEKEKEISYEKNDEHIKSLKNKENIRMLGADTGRVNLMVLSEEVETGWKVYKLTRRQFYKESGITLFNEKIKKWTVKIQKLLDKLSKFSTRNDLQTFLKYTEVITTHYNEFWSFYTKSTFSKHRFDIYSKKKKVYDSFFNKVKGTSKKEVVIAYGDGKFNSTAKFELSAPTTRLFKETKRHFKIAIIDEYNTSQKDYKTGNQLSKVSRIVSKEYLEKIKKRTANTKEINVERIGKRETIRGLLMCHSTYSKFLCRDTNASKNILKCLKMYPDRPSHLMRNSERIVLEIQKLKDRRGSSEEH